MLWHKTTLTQWFVGTSKAPINLAQYKDTPPESIDLAKKGQLNLNEFFN